MMRINKFIAGSGVCSRRKAEEYILQGLVKVNDVTVTDLACKVDEEKDVVTMNGQRLAITKAYEYIMLNKPKGYVTTMSDDRGRKSIVDLVGDDGKRLYPIGRLDYDSEGLLILTNDGDLTYRLTHPKFAIPKTYVVRVAGEIKESDLAVLRRGVVVDGVRYAGCRAKLVKFENGESRIELTLLEGKNREIRKMLSFMGHEVLFLKRTAFAGIRLGGLKRGESRPLRDFEVEYLKKL